MAAGVMEFVGRPRRQREKPAWAGMSWSGTSWALLGTAGLPLGVAAAAHRDLPAATPAALVTVALAGVAISVALALYVRWRITRAPQIAWVTVALTAAALEHLSLAATTLTMPGRLATRPVWTLLVDTVITAALVVLVLARRHRRPPLDPALLGVGLGLLAGAVRLPTLLAEPLLPASDQMHAATAALTLLLHLALALVLLLLGLPAALPEALVRVTMLLGVAALVVLPASSWHDAPLATWVGAGTGFLLAGTAIMLLQPTLVDSTRTIDGLRHRVDEVEAGVAADRERLHEINATIAGIACASRLVHDHADLPTAHRVRLDDLLAAEIQRLERLVEGRSAPCRDVDLDELVDRLVLSHRAMGRDVRWTRSDLVVRAQADDLAEILTTLLTNAAEHAPGSPVEIGAARQGDSVQITVSDHGPGVDGEMAERIFERGAHGHASRGQGIGLFVARRISEQLGGSLFVVPAQAGSSRGAVFVLTLPLTRSPRGALPTTT